MNDNSTICALSTPLGQGAIAVIRVSGANAISVCNRIFKPAGKNVFPPELGGRGAVLSFGRIVRNEEIIDEVMVSVFHAPRSYTGEDIVEISCHGSLYIRREILRLL